MSVHACFFYNDGRDRKKKKFRLRVGVFKQMGDNYLLDPDKWIDIEKRRTNSKTQDCESKYLIVPVQVQEGDRIAVRVKQQCNKQFCPLQPNIKASGSTSVFFTQSNNVKTIPVRQVMATESYTSVYLDVRASVGKFNGQ